MDLDEIFSRHQIALSDMADERSADRRAWAEECADYYADRIVSFGDRLGSGWAYRQDLLKVVKRG